MKSKVELESEWTGPGGPGPPPPPLGPLVPVPGAHERTLLTRLLTSKWFLLVKMSFVLFCCVGCATQVISVWQLYAAYPTTVSVFVEEMKELEPPGITLCNNNRLRLSKLRRLFPNFNAKWRRLSRAIANHNRGGHPSENDNETAIARQRLMDKVTKFVIRRNTIADITRLGVPYDSFIVHEFLRCSVDSMRPDTPCRDILRPVLTSHYWGNCYTLFYPTNETGVKDFATTSGLSQSPVLFGSDDEKTLDVELSEKQFWPNEVVRIKVNFSREEYSALNEPVSGILSIHDPAEVPTLREGNFLLKPGHYYEMFITKETIELLPAPYRTNCTDYPALNLKSSHSGGNVYAAPQSRENCMIGCLANYSVESCNCWPPELPFVVQSSPPSSSSSSAGRTTQSEEESRQAQAEYRNLTRLQWCDWKRMTRMASKKADVTSSTNLTRAFEVCFNTYEKICREKCKSDCKRNRYHVIIQDREWPSDERIKHSRKADYLQSQKECCAIVSIRYWSSHFTRNQYEPRFKGVEFVSYIGGLMSMWMGFSFITLFDLTEEALHRTWNQICYFKQARSLRQLVDMVLTKWHLTRGGAAVGAAGINVVSPEAAGRWPRPAQVATILGDSTMHGPRTTTNTGSIWETVQRMDKNLIPHGGGEGAESGGHQPITNTAAAAAAAASTTPRGSIGLVGERRRRSSQLNMMALTAATSGRVHYLE